METTQLKNNFHHLIDSFDNERILAIFFGLMSKVKDSVDGQLWSRLNKEEQEELILSDIEAEYPKNLISHSTIQKKHQTKRRSSELDVDYIGGQNPMTEEEEKAFSEFLKARKLLRTKKSSHL